MTATVRTAGTSPEELAELMAGRKVLLHVPKEEAKPGRTVLEVKDLGACGMTTVSSGSRGSI